MAFPLFDSFSLQDGNYISEEVSYRNTPSRDLETAKITRRPGVKLMSHDFGERRVRIVGHILGDSVSDLQSKIDDLHTNITRKEEGKLYVESNRSAVATVVSVAISDPHYAQDYVPFEIEFLLTDPFFYGSQQTVSWTIPASTTTLTDTLTISGSVYAEPTIRYAAPAGGGYTTTSGITVSYTPTGEHVTWSGTGPATLAYADSVSFDYASHLITQGVTEMDVEGVFSRWEPGSAPFTATFSGTAAGGTLEFIYQPRYL